MEDLYDLNERDKARTLIPDFDKNFLPGVRGTVLSIRDSAGEIQSKNSTIGVIIQPASGLSINR